MSGPRNLHISSNRSGHLVPALNVSAGVLSALPPMSLLYGPLAALAHGVSSVNGSLVTLVPRCAARMTRQRAWSVLAVPGRE